MKEKKIFEVFSKSSKMTQIENIAPKMDLSSLVSSSKSSRRRHAGGSLSGSLCGGSQNLIPNNAGGTGGSITNSHGGSAPRLYSNSGSKSTSELEGLRSALQDRDAVIHNLRAQLGVHCPSSTYASPQKKQQKNDMLNQQRSLMPNQLMSDAERVIAKRRLATLKMEGDRKRDAIGELKRALRKLDVTDNIDIRIKQAELEYALGREELDLLSISEEMRSLQGRIEQAQGPVESRKTIYSWLRTGIQLSLVAVNVSCDPSRPRWGVTFNNNNSSNFGLYIDWAAEGEPLRKGDRLLEVNGKILGTSRNVTQASTLDELSRLLAVSYDPAEVVVLRPKRAHDQNYVQASNRRLKADNLRLTHRICYLEEQVRELQTGAKVEPHVTSINISDADAANKADATVVAEESDNTKVEYDKCQHNGSDVPEPVEVFRRGNQVTTLLRGKIIKQHQPMDIAINNDATIEAHNNWSERSESRCSLNSIKELPSNKNYTLSQDERINRLKNESQTWNKNNGVVDDNDSVQICSLGADMQYDGSRMANPRTPPARPERPEVKRRTRTKHLFNYSSARSADEPISIPISSVDSRKVIDTRFEKTEKTDSSNNEHVVDRWDERSSKSLEFERCSNGLRPTPPKKPLRLSLHRARSLQTVQSPATAEQQPNPVTDLYSKVDSKRPSKRTHNLAKRVLHQHIL